MILTVGLERSVIDVRIFTVMVIMALVTTLMAAPLLAILAPGEHRVGAPDAARAQAGGATPVPNEAPAPDGPGRSVGDVWRVTGSGRAR